MAGNSNTFADCAPCRADVGFLNDHGKIRLTVLNKAMKIRKIPSRVFICATLPHPQNWKVHFFGDGTWGAELKIKPILSGWISKALELVEFSKTSKVL